MQYFRKRLPPLDPLLAFEAAARHSSFTLAAKELNITQAAVSQQIRNLEDRLGVTLFVRSHRAVKLSPQGWEYQHTVSDVLKQLASATAELTAPARKTWLTIAADQSIASMWLVPRLPHFQQVCPNAKIRLVASDDKQDCLADDVQIAIIHGKGKWHGFRAERLFEEEIFPVCSPAYFKHRKSPTSPASLVDETLLELEDSHWDWMTWRTWLGKKNIQLPTAHREFQVNSYPLLIEAAKNSQGVALGWRYLIDDEVANGNLVKPLDLSIRTKGGYFLVWHGEGEPTAIANIFRDWARHEVARQRNPGQELAISS